MSFRQWALWILLTTIILAVVGFMLFETLRPRRAEY